MLSPAHFAPLLDLEADTVGELRGQFAIEGREAIVRVAPVAGENEVEIAVHLQVNRLPHTTFLDLEANQEPIISLSPIGAGRARGLLGRQSEEADHREARVEVEVDLLLASSPWQWVTTQARKAVVKA